MLEVRSSRLENAAPAIQAAGRWARQFLISRSGFEAAVTDATREPVELVRVRWRGRSRRIVVRQTLTESRVRNVQEPLDPGALDPWSESAESLPARTLQLSRCRTCGGEKRVLCLTCRGSAVVGCEVCGGSGSVWSQRSGRMIACRTCRGDGKRRCSCRDGWLSCGPCGGKGKVEEWLEITEEPFDRVTCAGSDVLAQALPGCANPEKFDTDFFGCPVPLLVSWRGRTVEEAPAEPRSVLRLPELGGIHPKEDRLQEVALQVFRSETTTVVYQLGGVAGSVQVQGWDGGIVENDSSRGPFEHRRRRTLQGMAGAVLAGFALAVWYGGRHAFFRSAPNYGWLWLLALVLGLCIVPLVLRWVLPAERRKGRGALVAGLPALLVALTQAGIAATGGPSLDHARAVAARGQLEEALRESAACFDLGVEAEPAGAFHDQLQLGKVRQAREPRNAWEAASSLPFLTETGKEQARAHAMEVTIQASAALQEKGEFTESAAVLDSAPPELRHTGSLVGLRRRVYLEDALPLWKVIESRRKSLEDRVAACNDIAPHLQGLASLPASPDDATLMPLEVEEKCAQLREQRLAEIERKREAEARAAERVRRREEAAREAAQRRWARAPLLCNDGTPSPTCICGGSRRGCCSWHGGVAGCSAEYPN